MEGYKIIYREKGVLKTTFFGNPFTNVNLSRDEVEFFVAYCFHNAYPNCSIEKIEPGFFE